ncbi:fibrinogen C domain-containing protein 1-like isoform X2 [Drosophila innubila]|uniref:fibrinogen C domain-containing protein 1-like isoform X2 n=1 Tax=Drosophila innubila TaxID=198719 RepID=UPI00148DB326|nr:fibrinogen C domain-containing protein 1-like isoform X2 [Drosophila innubila]
MLSKILCVILVMNPFLSFSNATLIPKRNETNLLQSTINNQLSELRANLERQIKDALDMKPDIGFLKTVTQFLTGNIESLRAQLEKQKIDGANKESVIQQLRADFQSLSAELEKQKNDGVNKESVIQQLRADFQSLSAELEKQKPELVQLKQDGTNRQVEIQLLKAMMEQQQKFEVDNQSLRAEIERQREILDKYNTWLNISTCSEAKFSGIYETQVSNFSSQPFKVACDALTHGGGWTVILKRMDGSVNFYRNWTEYKTGFGDLDGEFFLGLDKIHALTEARKQELLVVLEDFEGVEAFESYDAFAIGNEDQQYVLHTLGKANGTAGDALNNQRGMKFSTFDRKNDESDSTGCAIVFTGAWWYKNCHDSNLAGKYKDNTYGKGVIWQQFRGNQYSLKKAVMLIRPAK